MSPVVRLALEDLVVHEALVVRLAFEDLVGRVCLQGTDPDTVPLAEVRDGLDELGLDRFAGLLLANRIVDTIEEGLELAMEVRAEWLHRDRRPRTLMEALTPDERAGVEQAFARAAQPWWARIKARVRRALVADDETSAWMDRADREQRMREGKP